MEYITYHNSYTEFLVPNTSLKVTVHSDGSGHIEDMSDRNGGICFSNGNTDTLCDKLRDAEDMASNLKVTLGNKDQTIRGLNADMKGMERIVALQDKGIKTLNDKLTKMTALEDKQFQAKWDALGKLDEMQDTIDQLREELEAVTEHRDALVTDHDLMLDALKVTESVTNITLNKLETLHIRSI
jgi:uncharacterized coiled-coil protein SlyX